MKIAMVTDIYCEIGGTEQAIKNFTGVLEDKGHDIQVVLFDGTRKMFTPISHLHSFDPDIIHVHTPGPIGNLGALYSKVKEIPILGSFHSLPEVRFYFENHLEKKVFDEFIWRFLKYFYNRCDTTLVPTEEVRKLLGDKGFEKLKVIPYGIDVTHFKPKSDNGLREKLGLNEDDLVLLYAGWFRKDKRVDLLVESLKFLPSNAKLLLIGDGPQKNMLLDKSRRLGVSDRVLMYSSVPNYELVEFYNSADIYVNASMSETLGISMIEAMSCGLPVVASNSPGAREIIEDGVNGYLAELFSSRSIADKVELLYDYEKRGKIAENSRRIAKEKYDLIEIGQRLEELYISLLE